MTVFYYDWTTPGAPVFDNTTTLTEVLAQILFAAGWTIPFGTTNKRAFVSAAPGPQNFYRFEYNGSGTASTETALIACESMPDIDHVSNPWCGNLPSSPLRTPGMTPTVAARAWFTVVDQFTCTFCVETSPGSNQYYWLHFGDYWDYRARARRSIVWATTEGGHGPYIAGSVAEANDTSAFVRINRNWDNQLATRATIVSDTALCTSGAFAGALPYPDVISGKTYLPAMFVCDPAAGRVLGKIRGQRLFAHAIDGVSMGQVIPGDDEDTGKSFKIIKPLVAMGASGGPLGVACFETSDTWLTNV
jgi:hypothetical protein